jgi:hypothetical protein
MSDFINEIIVIAVYYLICFFIIENDKIAVPKVDLSPTYVPARKEKLYAGSAASEPSWAITPFPEINWLLFAFSTDDNL